ncbi:hypothetical protein GJAV_G00195500 [Gymnothorax javanicus]|nr:hypothetical protein GJAV_G00195500 [Gymnothorax javanicus]
MAALYNREEAVLMQVQDMCQELIGAAHTAREDYGNYCGIERPQPSPSFKCLTSGTEPVEDCSYTMYHGTSAEAARQIVVHGFRQSSDGMLGRGVYVSRDLRKASKYPLELPEHKRVVLKLKVDLGKVKKINCKGHPMQKTWHYEGYDTAWVPPNCGMVKSGQEEDCVWDPNRITVIDAIRPTPGVGDEARSCDYAGEAPTSVFYMYE